MLALADPKALALYRSSVPRTLSFLSGCSPIGRSSPACSSRCSTPSLWVSLGTFQRVLLHQMAWKAEGFSLHSGYFTTFLLVAGNKSVKAATRIRNIPSFVSLFSALSTGVIVRYTKHIKPVMMAGFVIEVLGLGQRPPSLIDDAYIRADLCNFHSPHGPLPSKHKLDRRDYCCPG